MAIQDLIPWRRESRARWEDGSPIALLQRDMNRMFEEFWTGGDIMQHAPAPFPELAGEEYPRVELRENKDSIELTAELPGMKDKDIRLTLAEDAETIAIAGEKRAARQKKTATRLHSERAYGHFFRCIALPAQVDGDKIKAKFKDGVLRVRMPKLSKKKQRGHKIPIKS